MNHTVRSTIRCFEGAAALLAAAVTSTGLAAAQGASCLVDSIPATSLTYGQALATDGERVILQLTPHDVSVFERRGPTWERAADLFTPSTFSGTHSAALDGDRAAVIVGNNPVRFYERGSGSWGLAESYESPVLVTNILALDGEVMLLEVLDFVTLPFPDVSVVVRQGNTWVETARLGLDLFPSAISLSGRTIALGFRATMGNEWIDMVEVTLAGEVRRTQRLSPPTPFEGFGYGQFVSLDGDRLVTSAFRDVDGNGVFGALYVYERSAGGGFQLAARVDDPPSLGRIPGVAVFGTRAKLQGDRILAAVVVGTGANGPQQVGHAILEPSPVGWELVSLLDPRNEVPGSNSWSATLVGDAIFVDADGPQGVIRRFSVGTPQGVQVCAGSAVSGQVPSLSIDGCTSAAAGQLVVRASGMQTGQLLVGLARGAATVAPSGVVTCIRPAGSLGRLTPSGPGAASLAVNPALVQALPAMFGQVLLIQAYEATFTPASGFSANLSNALAIELAD